MFARSRRAVSAAFVQNSVSPRKIVFKKHNYTKHALLSQEKLICPDKRNLIFFYKIITMSQVLRIFNESSRNPSPYLANNGNILGLDVTEKGKQDVL